MAGGFNFSIDFDSSQFKAGSDDAAASLEKLTQAMEDVERSDVSDAERGVEDLGTAADTATTSARDLGSEFTDAFDRARRDARDAETAVDDLGAAADTAGGQARDLGDDATDALDGVGESARTAGEGVTEGLEQPLTAAQDMMNEVKASMTESLGELAGSFAENGFNMEDSIDGIVEVAAEAAGALPGPWSLAGAALVAVAAGVYGEWQQRMEDIAERASEMYDDMLESGASFISNDYFQKQLQAFFDPMGESYDANMSKINVLEDLGVPTDQAARALVGYGDDADVVLEKVQAGFDLLHDDIQGNAGAYGELGLTGEKTLNGIIATIEDSRESTDTARSAVKAYRDSIAEIPTDVDTDVKVSDVGTIRDTQRDIDDIHGTDVTVKVRADTSSVYEGIAAAVAHAGRQTATIPVTARRVGGFYP